jgi:hypothetical protein
MSLTSLIIGLLVLAASANACPVVPTTSLWEGSWHSNGGYSGVWKVTYTSTETSPGNYEAKGPGEVFVYGFNVSLSGEGFGLLECTSATTDKIVGGHWEDTAHHNDALTGELALSASSAVETGTWKGGGVRGPEEGSWTGEFHPTANNSGGPVKGKVELETSPGTLATLSEPELESHLPLLPPTYFAPVGGLNFTIQLASGVSRSKVKLTLPPGSNPTGLLKLVGGTYREVTPATIVGDTVEFEVTDGGPFDEDGTVNGVIKDPVVPVHRGLAITTTALPQATHGVGYNAELVAAGGTPPYKWKKIGALPKKLKLRKNGAVSGAPSVGPGSYPIAAKVTDSKKMSATATLNLTVK